CRWPLFERDEIDRLRAIADEYLADAAVGRRPIDLNQPHYTDTRLFSFLLSERALDLVERLLAPDLLLWSSQFFCKHPLVGAPVPWHADGYYWTNYIDPVRVLSIFLALDEQTSQNGCLRVLSGSHVRAGTFTYRRASEEANPFFPRGVPVDTLDRSSMVDV